MPTRAVETMAIVSSLAAGTRALSDADKIAVLGGNVIKRLRLDPVS